MKMKSIGGLLTVLLLSGFMFGCAGKSQTVNKEKNDVKADAVAIVEEQELSASFIAEGNNKFAVELYKKLSADKNANIFFSPYSIYTAYGMLFEGASGESVSEYINVFGYPKDNDFRRNIIKKQIEAYQDKESEYGVVLANSLWVNKEFPVLKAYKKVLTEYYLAESKKMDFSDKTSVSVINKWVSDNTAEKIKDIIPEGALSEATQLVLVNTVYFKERWMIPFDKQATQSNDFTLADGSKSKTDLMFKNEKYPYFEDDKVQTVKIRYKADEAGNKMSMIAVLPKQNNIADAEDFIYSNTVNSINKKFAVKKGNVFLPKFEYKWNGELSDVIYSMGLKSSDYSKASKTPIHISSVLHSTFIKVDEEETEAAASTAIMMKMSMPINEEPPFNFRADHPFVYIIVDDNDGKILFMGKMEKPGEGK